LGYYEMIGGNITRLLSSTTQAQKFMGFYGIAACGQEHKRSKKSRLYSTMIRK